MIEFMNIEGFLIFRANSIRLTKNFIAIAIIHQMNLISLLSYFQVPQVWQKMIFDPIIVLMNLIKWRFINHYTTCYTTCYTQIQIIIKYKTLFSWLNE
jgi:hypothetical protein